MAEKIATETSSRAEIANYLYRQGLVLEGDESLAELRQALAYLQASAEYRVEYRSGAMS